MAKVKSQAPSVVYTATGRRKRAIARGPGNPRQGRHQDQQPPAHEYVGRKTLEQIVREALVVADAVTNSTCSPAATAAASPARPGAVRHGIARALLVFDEISPAAAPGTDFSPAIPGRRKARSTAASVPAVGSSGPNGRLRRSGWAPAPAAGVPAAKKAILPDGFSRRSSVQTGVVEVAAALGQTGVVTRG